MKRRHEEQLLARLDTLFLSGTVFILKEELYYWFGIMRLAKSPWNKIKQLWDELLVERHEKAADLIISESTFGYAFFYPRNEKKLSELAR
jgi:hypothetical protein